MAQFNYKCQLSLKKYADKSKKLGTCMHMNEYYKTDDKREVKYMGM